MSEKKVVKVKKTTIKKRPAVTAPSEAVPVAAKSPEYAAKSPEYVARSPEYVATSPKLVAISPDFIAQSPEYVARSPEYVAISPKLVAISPDFIAQSPEYVEEQSAELEKNITPEARNKTIQSLFELYLKNITKDSSTEELELEVKFGTLGIKPITRINYDNIIKHLLPKGFYIDKTVDLLRIQNEYMDIKTGLARMSAVRTEINGIQNIRKYCQTNSLKTIENGVAFIQKNRFDNNLFNVDVLDYNFRISLNKETKLKNTMPLVRAMTDKWNDNKKIFRYLNRVKLRHPHLPVIIDMSIVKESKKQGRSYVPEYNIHDANVFNGDEKCEVEVEFVNSLVGVGTPYDTPAKLYNEILKPVVKFILEGIQDTPYPISYSEQRLILQLYMVLIWGKDYNENIRITPSNFVGPSSYTLEMKNIRPLNPDLTVPNIRENFAVTDKADGERKLMFISPDGKIYLINTNMDVQYTGTMTNTKELWNSLLDGEHILHNKNKQYLNMYAAFDFYYRAGQDIRAKAFVPVESGTEEDENISYNNFRLPLLESALDILRPMSVVKSTDPAPLKITKKRFYAANRTNSIFQCCNYIMTKEHDGLFEYETDGLIFTATNRGVGSSKIGEYLKPLKTTWDYSFKWKPSQFNTIDFFVTFKKNENGTDFIGSAFNNGTDMGAASQIPEYKTAILRVGFNESKHGFVNPYQDMIDDKIPNEGNMGYKDQYMPMQFYPTDPSDYKAGICNLLINNNDKNIYTENNEIIEDNTIVEFRYELTNEEQWRWIPLRMRYDKTAQLRAGEKNFGNAFHVANSNWHSIHNPITRQMIMTGETIPEELNDDDVYYNKVSGVSKTRALRDFHNLYVKQMLIKSVTKPGNTLIDLAVGKGGDFPKWIDAKLKFVFGVDIARDNIQNRLDGACARYLNYRKQYKVMPAALFVNGNSSVNIKKTTGILVDKDKQITRAVFGQGPKDVKILGKGVYNQYGVAADGFDVTSIQFAIHYMFENQETLQNFLQNVSEVTKEGGYFICTSYDGEKMFNLLKNVKENESKVIFASQGSENDGQKKIWEVTKRYDRAEFTDDETSVGYAIDIFQETINKTFREYLVNYSYLTRLIENYGFVPVSEKELKEIKAPLTTSTNLFSEVFHKMNEEIKKNPRAATSYKDAPTMSDGERTISFLNRYFIYKKVRKISDVDKVASSLKQGLLVETETGDAGEMPATVPVSLATATASLAPASLAPASLASAKPGKKIITIKKNAPKLSTIIEIPSSTLKANAPTLAPQVATTAAPAPAPAPAAAAAATEKPTVKKLKRTMKITN